MMNTTKSPKENWLVWLALQHFLPASALKEVCREMVSAVSDDRIAINDLFDESLSGDAIVTESWILRPKSIDGQLHHYLQNKISNLVWKSDYSQLILDENLTSQTSFDLALLEFAIELGKGDLSFLPKRVQTMTEETNSSLLALDNALRICASAYSSKTSLPVSEVKEAIYSLPANLQAIILKHLGDLFVDSDEWASALSLYEVSLAYTEDAYKMCWGLHLATFKGIVIQSISACELMINGAETSSKRLISILSSTNVSESPLLIANASFDAYVAESEAKNTFIPDSRSLLLTPPLLHTSHSLLGPLRSWVRKDFSDLHGKFWALLRRQISLGLVVESRETKSYFARSILDHMIHKPMNDVAYFNLAIKLLIESEAYKDVASISWSESFVDAHVDASTIEFIINHIAKQPGRSLKRNQVASAIFHEWCLKISVNKIDVVTVMLRFLIDVISSSEADIRSNNNLLKVGLDAYMAIGKRRPEFKAIESARLADALALKIRQSGFWTGTSAALETSLEFASDFSQVSLKNLVTETLALLEKIDPSAEFWVVVRPAMVFLSSRKVKELAEDIPELGNKIVSEILRFGSVQETLSSSVIFYLQEFSPELLQDESVKEKLALATKTVRQRALSANSSNTTANIMALFVAPQIAGFDGIENAFDGLEKIVSTENASRSSLAFQDGYEPFLHLRSLKESIEKVYPDAKQLDKRFSQLYIGLCELWDKAKSDASRFAPFSFSNTKAPDLTLVHNWAFASLLFAKMLDKFSEMKLVIEAASANEILSNAITLAFATYQSSSEDQSLNDDALKKIASDDRDSFYSALGRRLVVFQKTKNGALGNALFAQTLRLGPDLADAAVLSIAAGAELHFDIALLKYLPSYESKLSGEGRKVALTLSPLVELIKNKCRQ